MNDALATHPQAQLVPAGYAEKAMASLMQLHSELMDEKERRVDLYRRLMEREQALAELKMYVQALEERVSPKPAPTPVAVAPVGQPPAPAAPTPPQVEAPRPVMPAGAPPQRVAPVPPRVLTRPRPDGWKTW